MTEPKFTVQSVPVLDTGIGVEMGYANDAELIEAARIEREAALACLTPEMRARFEAAERAQAVRFVRGRS